MTAEISLYSVCVQILPVTQQFLCPPADCCRTWDPRSMWRSKKCGMDQELKDKSVWRMRCMFCGQCRERGVSYSGRIMVRCGWKVNGTAQMPFERYIGHVPIMVKVPESVSDITALWHVNVLPCSQCSSVVRMSVFGLLTFPNLC